MHKRFAIILCGSGFKDGSEIRESVATLHALSQLGAEFQCFAPDQPQRDVINCLTGKPIAGESRNQLIEAARIARGQVRPLTELKAQDYSGLIIPGGFGVAKNLCTFGIEGTKGSVNPEVARVIREFHNNQKPIGAICIAPALLGMTFGKDVALTLTLGGQHEAAQEIAKLGHTLRSCSAREVACDLKNKVVSTPAYMEERAPLHHIFEGIHELVKQVIAWSQ